MLLLDIFIVTHLPLFQPLNLLLNIIAHENKTSVIVSDFNIDLLKYANEFYNTMTSNYYSPFILQPTRPISKSLIDNIFLNTLEYKSTSGNITIQLSDHLFQFVILEGFFKDLRIPKLNIYQPNFKYFNEGNFNFKCVLDIYYVFIIMCTQYIFCFHYLSCALNIYSAFIIYHVHSIYIMLSSLMCTQYILCFCYLCVLNIYYVFIIMCTQYIFCFHYLSCALNIYFAFINIVY